MSEEHFLTQLLSLSNDKLSQSLSLGSIPPLLVQLLSCSSQRLLLHTLISRLSSLSLLSLPLLITYIKHYYPSNQLSVKNVISIAFDSSPSLELAYSQLVPKAIELELGKDEKSYQALETLLVCFIAGNEFIASPPPSIDSLNQLYTTLSTLPSPTPQVDQLRLTILTTLSTILSSSAATSLDQLESTLQTCLSLSLSSPSILLQDLEQHLQISTELNKSVTGIVGDKARHVKDLIGKLRKVSSVGGREKGDSQDWIERIRRRNVLGGNAEKVVNDAGFEKTQRDGGDRELERSESEAEVVSAISTIQDLFPQLSTQFLRLALEHSSFKPSSDTRISEVQERLVGALLEDDLPVELKKARDTPDEPMEPVQVVNGKGKGKAVENREIERRNVVNQDRKENERRNVFDEDRNFSRGTLLTKNSNQRPKAQIELDERLKESIIALAEAPSSDEEDEYDGGEAFLEDGEEGGARLGVRDNGEEDEEDEGESRIQSGTQTPISVGAGSNTNPISNPSLVAHLESLYLSSPSLFSPDSATRRSKERTKLRESTGLDNQQLEGWKIMLERGGADKIQKMREKQMDMGASSNHLPPAAQAPVRGGRGGGRGRGGGEGRARGKGDGGRAQHMRRQRGNDKKMQKMGATL